MAIDGLRQKYEGRRLWVIFEPRSNTTRRKVFQKELATSLQKSDLVVIPSVPDPDKVAEEDRLSPEQLVADVVQGGTEAWFLNEVEEIVAHVAERAVSGDVVAVLSNGGFGGIHGKLLAALED